VFLVRALDYGGAQRQLVTLANALDKERFEITVISFYSGQPLEKELARNIRFVSLAKRGRWDLSGFLRRLIREVRAIRPDVIHGYLDIPNLLALFSKLLVRTKVIWGIRAVEIDLRHYDWLLKAAAKLERLCARFADLIIVNSNAGFAHHSARGFPVAKMTVIPNGIDTDIFRPDRKAGVQLRLEWGVGEQAKLVGTVGRLDPMKDLPGFLRAAAIVARQSDDVRFVCVGAGPESYVLKLKELADELGLADRVLWPGARADMTAVYNALDVLVSSSIGESFPNSIGEAMACGAPCVVTDVGDSAVILGACGVVVPPRDAEVLSAAVLFTLNAERNAIGIRARGWIDENYTVAKMAKLTEEGIKGLTIKRCHNDSSRL
jgi:glycosyltransferase involved in cell wall biosynthesis